MFYSDFERSSLERRGTAEPLVDHHCKGVLIAGTAWSALQLFRSKIERGACHLLGHGMGAVGIGRRCE